MENQSFWNPRSGKSSEVADAEGEFRAPPLGLKSDVTVLGRVAESLSPVAVEADVALSFTIHHFLHGRSCWSIASCG